MAIREEISAGRRLPQPPDISELRTFRQALTRLALALVFAHADVWARACCAPMV
jgi:hypothetical protein